MVQIGDDECHNHELYGAQGNSHHQLEARPAGTNNRKQAHNGQLGWEGLPLGD